MGRSFGSRTLLAICGALVVLLAAFAALQYRWSTRVAAADLQREKEHLDSAASLFASEFNDDVGKTVAFLQNDAWAALQSGARLTAEGLFAPSPLPAWISIPPCAALAIERPAALIPFTTSPLRNVAPRRERLR